MSAGLPQTRNTQLQPQGWTRRFTAFGRRLSEATALYEQLGYDVLLEPAKVNDAEAVAVEGSGCQTCFVMAQARTIYTRPRPMSLPHGSLPGFSTPEEVNT